MKRLYHHIFLLAAIALATLTVSASDRPTHDLVPTVFEGIDKALTLVEHIDLDARTGDALSIRYGTTWDSGVELERIRAGEVVWRKYVQPLGVEHSRYRHKVQVTIAPDESDIVRITSTGVKVIHESLSLSDGRQLSREVKAVTK